MHRLSIESHLPVSARLAHGLLECRNLFPCYKGIIGTMKDHYFSLDVLRILRLGKGQTPVGQSYDPRPADLSAASTQALPEGELYRRMLTGKGHEPVMKTTVPPERRWQIVDFVRTLQAPQER